jgi:anti-sigma B factor antagonist
VEEQAAPTADEFSISVRAGRGDAGTMIVRVRGEIDILTGRTVEEVIYRELADGVTTLVVDLSGVSFLGATGLSILCRVKDACRLRATEFSLGGIVAESVARPLQMTGLERLLLPAA